MKASASVSFKSLLVSFFVLLASCSDVFEPDGITLPNGITLTDSQITRLAEFELQYFQDNLNMSESKTAGSISVLSDEEIEAIKIAFIEEFGEEAYSFYGETVTEKYYNVNAVGLERTIVGLTPYNGVNFRVSIDGIMNWGPWWANTRIEPHLQYYNTYEGWKNVSTFAFTSSSIQDEVTPWKTVQFDMVNYDQTNVELIIRHDTIAAVGGYSVRGNNKYGFFPKIASCNFQTTWSGNGLPSLGFSVAGTFSMQ